MMESKVLENFLPWVDNQAINCIKRNSQESFLNQLLNKKTEKFQEKCIHKILFKAT